MKFMSAKEFSKKTIFTLSENDFIITSFSLSDRSTTMFVDLLQPEDCDDLVKLLNKINNQGIETIYPTGYVYVRNGKRLGYSCLSSGERVFLFCFIAARYNVKLYMTRLLKQLTQESLDLLFSAFGSSDNIIYYDEDFEVHWYEKLQNEYLSRR